MLHQFSFFGTNGDPIPSPWVTSFGGGTGTNSINSNRMKLLTPAVGAYGASARADFNKPFWDVEILFRVTPSQTWATESFLRVGLGDQWNGATQNGFTNGYSMSPQGGATPVLNLGSMVAGTETNPATTTPTYSGSSAYWFRWRKQGTGMSVKYWQDTTAEPLAWTLTATVTTFPSAPLHLMFGVNSGSAASAVGFEIDKLTVDDLRASRPSTLFRRT